MEQKKHYLVYQTTCLINGKIYIGQHQTYDLNDGYLGSGILLRRAIEKYGKENFKREILFECSSVEEMNAKEAELVNEEFLKRDDVYNLKEGGEGGWDFCNTPEHHNNIGNCRNTGITQLMLQGRNPGRETIAAYSEEELKEYCHKVSIGVKRFIQNHGAIWTGKHHTEETKRKIGSKSRIHQKGCLNSQFGRVWIYNESLKKNMTVKKELVEGFLSEGWKLGRRMSF